LCEDCAAALCTACVVTKRAHTVEYHTCSLCNGRVVPRVRHRADVTPLAERLRGVWRYPFTRPSLLVVALLAAFQAALTSLAESTWLLLKWMPLLFSAAIFWTWFFSIIRSTAKGASEVETPEFVDVFSDAFIPALRGVVATAVIWVPATLYWYSANRDAIREAFRVAMEDPRFYVTGVPVKLPAWTPLLGEPLFLLLVLAGLAYLPMALLLAARGTVLGMLNPLAVLRGAQALGRDYALTVGTLALLCVPLVAGRWLSDGLRALEVPLLSPWLAQGVGLLVPFMMAHALGLLLHVRGDAIGHGIASDYLETVVPHAQEPSTSLRPGDALPPEPEPAAESAATESQLQALAAAVEAKDGAQVLALYAELRWLPRTRIAAEHHLFVGQTAAAKGDFALAVQALEAAADCDPDGPGAPRALVLLARVLGERMAEAARAQDVYRYIVERYPNTDASRFAQSRLSTTS
jgi:hypothetical protein